jgi:hypothetical protein
MSLLDSLIAKIDSAVDLYGVLKGFDNAIDGPGIRDSIGYESEYWSSPEGLATIASMVANPVKAAPTFIKALITNAINGRPVADGTAPYSERQKKAVEKPAVKKVPPPYKNNTITPTAPPAGHPSPSKPPVTVKPRKLIKPATNPGFTPTEITQPINAKTQIGNKKWGELICYCIEEKGFTLAAPNFEADSVIANADKTLDSLIGIIYADAMPTSLPNRQAIKAKISYWASAAWAAPDNIQGLTGDVSLHGGADSLYSIAQAMSIQSMNAYVGFEPELYLATEEVDYAATLATTRNYADVPFLAGQTRMDYEIGVLKDMDLGVFMGIPYDQWLRATPKTGNLQLQFYGKSKPPYSFKGPDGKTARYRPSEVNIPDPRELTWAEIKSAASPYTSGGHCCTIQLACGRPIVAWANSDDSAEARARKLATLSTSPVTDKDPVFTIIKSKPTVQMYPGIATYVGGSGPKQKMKLWVDKVEDSGYDDALLKEEDLSTLV